MSNYAFRVVFCLVMGLLLTVVVAWRHMSPGSMIPWSNTSRVKLSSSEVRNLWNRYISDEEFQEGAEGLRVEKSGETFFQFGNMNFDLQHNPKGHEHHVDLFQVGLPFLALEGSGQVCIHATPSGLLSSQNSFPGLCPTPSINKNWLFIFGPARPIHPIWMGLFLNTIFYGVIVWFGLMGISRIRKRARLDRWRCPGCNYIFHKGIIDGVDRFTCSECGLTLDAGLLARPRQVIRWWLVLFLLPVPILGILHFFNYFSGDTLRVRMLDGAPLWSPLNLLVMLGLGAVLFILADASYQDRPKLQCRILSVMVALLVGPLTFISVYFMVLGFPI